MCYGSMSWICIKKHFCTFSNYFASNDLSRNCFSKYCSQTSKLYIPISQINIDRSLWEKILQLNFKIKGYPMRIPFNYNRWDIWARLFKSLVLWYKQYESHIVLTLQSNQYRFFVWQVLPLVCIKELNIFHFLFFCY